VPEPVEPAPEPQPVPEPVPQPPPFACESTPQCAHYGLCSWNGGACVATQSSCSQSWQCREFGFCTEQAGQCMIGGDSDCGQSNACRMQGLCAADGQRCVAREDRHCLRAHVCAAFEACDAQGGACVPGDAGEDWEPGGAGPRSLGMRNTGIGFTIAGPILALISVPMLFVGLDSNSDDPSLVISATVIGPLGGTMLVFGVPMWALGAQEIPANTEPESSGMLVGGLVMSALGISGLTAGAFGLLLSEGERGFAIPMAMGAAFVIPGIAMSVYGIETVPRTRDGASLHLGAGSAELTLRF
jgi:hypothetical protein